MRIRLPSLIFQVNRLSQTLMEVVVAATLGHVSTIQSVCFVDLEAFDVSPQVILWGFCRLSGPGITKLSPVSASLAQSRAFWFSWMGSAERRGFDSGTSGLHIWWFCHNLQLSVKRSLKSEAVVPNQTKCSLQVGDESLPQAEEFNYLGI